MRLEKHESLFQFNILIRSIRVIRGGIFSVLSVYSVVKRFRFHSW